MIADHIRELIDLAVALHGFLRLPEPVVEAGVNALIGVRGDHHFPGVDQEAVQKVFCAMLLEYCAHLQATGQDAHGYSEQLASIALRRGASHDLRRL